MLLRNHKDHGIFFAIRPRHTPEGWAVGWLHYKWVEGWGWGSDGHWAYANWVPGKDYDMGKRRNFGPFADAKTWDEEQRRLHANPPDHYATPPDISKCRNNLDKTGPTACWYPHCTCMNVGGSTCSGK